MYKACIRQILRQRVILFGDLRLSMFSCFGAGVELSHRLSLRSGQFQCAQHAGSLVGSACIGTRSYFVRISGKTSRHCSGGKRSTLKDCQKLSLFWA